MILGQIPPDGGMLYSETNMEHFFPEPLNAITSCLFLVIAVYWTANLWGRWSRHRFLSLALVLLYTGGIGGTIYHGLRQWRFFIMMDWMPIMLLCVAAGIYFTAKLTRWYYAAILVMLYVVFQMVARNIMIQGGDLQLFINVNYAVLAGMVLLPVFAFLIRTGFFKGYWVGAALLAFMAALTFRIADSWGWLAHGTHFLWHIFGSVAAHCMFNYIYLINENQTLSQ